MSLFVVGLVGTHLLAVGLAGGVSLAVYRARWDRPIGRAFVAMTVAFVVWAAFSLLRMFTTDPDVYVALTTLKYLGVATAPVWFLVFALLYADADRLVGRRTVAGLLVVPAVTVCLLATTHRHGLFYTGFSATAVAGVETLATSRGPWFWAFAVYGWGLLAVGSLLLLYRAVQLPPLYRTHAALVVAGMFVPWAAGLGYVLYGWPHPAVDPSPVGFAVAGGLWALGVFSSDLVDVSPVARTRVVGAMTDPVVVVDTEGRLVDANDAARPLIDGDRPHGAPVAAVLPSPLAAAIEADDGDRETVEIRTDDGPAFYDLREFRLGDRGEYGTAYRLSEVTTLVRTQRELAAKNETLAQQNERLEEFASVIAHDLQSPLSVARGNLQLLERECESGTEYVAEVEDAVDRMERLTTNILELARQGKHVDDPGPVDLESAVRAAWEAAPTGRAALSVVSELGILQADRRRLEDLFDNLFRNAVEHGGDEVTVRVGRDGNVLYVEDTGPGIPEGDREDVFEYGYTTSTDGTGFGLNIVRNIVEAHGWDIAVTDGADGGARFEVDTADDRPLGAATEGGETTTPAH